MSSLTSATVDIDRAIAVVALAFSADPVNRWAYPDAHTYYLHYPSFVRAFSGRAFETGGAFVTEGYEGVALWLPPGVHPDEEALAAITEESVPPERLEGLSQLLELQSMTHPTEPHWYLPMIGVDPLHQGKGIGSQLLREGLSVCDQAGLPAYLEATNEGSGALYLRHGFEVMAELQVSGSPPVWPMWRRPR
jgi:ribosomal protein S18 acetylase RimI-like enzyme